MAHRQLLLGLLLVVAGTAVAGCGGRVTAESTGASAGGSAGSGGPTGGAGQGGQDFAACGPSDTCVLESVFPCGPGCEPIPLSALVAINRACVTEYLNNQPRLECVALPCQPVTPDQISSPNYYATCELGRCQAVDLRDSPQSACTNPADCGIRSGTTCCGCGSDNWVAYSIRANVEQVFCAPAAGCAADCAVSVPPALSASCDASGHCAVSWIAPD